MTKVFMRATLALSCAIFYGVLIVGCDSGINANAPKALDLKTTIATVGERTISLGDLAKEEKRYKTLFMIEGARAPGGDQGQMLRRAILGRLIDNMLMEMEAERLGVTVSDKELEREVSRLLGKYDSARLGLLLAENEISYDQWKKSLIERIRARKLTMIAVDPGVTVLEKEIKQFFKEHAHDFLWPKRVRALHIMVGDEVAAEKIRKRLLSGEDFATIAMETSQSPDAASGGDLGYFSRGQMPPEFEEAVFKLKESEISNVIKSIYGFHLFKVIKKKKLRPMKYSEAHARIRTLIFDKKREEVFRNWAKKIKEGVTIKIFPDRLSASLP